MENTDASLLAMTRLQGLYCGHSWEDETKHGVVRPHRQLAPSFMAQCPDCLDRLELAQAAYALGEANRAPRQVDVCLAERLQDIEAQAKLTGGVYGWMHISPGEWAPRYGLDQLQKDFHYLLDALQRSGEALRRLQEEDDQLKGNARPSGESAPSPSGW